MRRHRGTHGQGWVCRQFDAWAGLLPPGPVPTTGPFSPAGSSGIVGSGITRQLLMEGAKVVALLRKVDQKAGLLRDCQG